ncbi:MAG: permease [Candidatus Sabulitectum sp.]|nr:permease [Candidatus Sabulitectum sp.]
MKAKFPVILFLVYAVFVVFSLISGYQPGKDIGSNFLSFTLSMLKILPAAFVLIGLFQVWISKERVEKHLGEDSSVMSFVWVLLLAGTIAGGLYVAFPVAWALYEKGARLQVILAYIGFAAVCRIPMIVFEISFMGAKFTMIRLMVSIPLVVVSSVFLARYLTAKDWRMTSPE